MRHKDFGIWQAWTWAQMLEEVRAFSVGLAELGLKRGDKFTIIGNNRPRLYWAMCAGQALGAVPVPVYADAVADEMAYVLAHAEVTLAVVEDQEQVDKIIAVSDRLPHLGQVIYDEPRGLKDYDHGRLIAFEDVQGIGRKKLASDPECLRRWEAGVAAGKGSDLSVILYTSGTTGRSKGVMLTYENTIVSARNANAFDRLDQSEEVIAYLPLAWVGDYIFSYVQSYVAGYCVNCPEAPDTVVQDRREIGTTYAFAPPRVYENILTLTTVRMADAGALKRKVFDFFIAVAGALGREDPRWREGAAERALALWHRQSAGLWPVDEPVRAVAHPRRLYRGRGDRAGNLSLLARHRPQSETALRPDRSLGLRHRAAGRRDLRRHRGQGLARCRDQDLRQRRSPVIALPACLPDTTKTPTRPPRCSRPTAGCTPAMPVSSIRRPAN